MIVQPHYSQYLILVYPCEDEAKDNIETLFDGRFYTTIYNQSGNFSLLIAPVLLISGQNPLSSPWVLCQRKHDTRAYSHINDLINMGDLPRLAQTKDH